MIVYDSGEVGRQIAASSWYTLVIKTSHTHKHITLAQKHSPKSTGASEWRDLTSISFQLTVVSIRFSPPCCLRALILIPASHIKMYEINTCTHRIRQMHSGPTQHTMLPSCHSDKPSACPTLLLRMFWTSTAVWFPQKCVYVCVCALMCSLVGWGIETDGGHPTGLSLIPQQHSWPWLAMTIQKGMKPAGGWRDDWIVGALQQQEDKMS